MAKGSSSSRIAMLLVAIPLVLLGLWLASMFMPLWRWTNLDFAEIAKKSGVPIAKLSKEFTCQIRYHPRGEGDPLPWQLILTKPTYDEIYEPKAEDSEDKLLVRIDLISENDGKPPGILAVGGTTSTYWDRYYTCTAWRLPPGSCGRNAKRPVIVYRDTTWQKHGRGTAGMYDEITREKEWANDDEWPDRDDGWRAPGKAP